MGTPVAQVESVDEVSALLQRLGPRVFAVILVQSGRESVSSAVRAVGRPVELIDLPHPRRATVEPIAHALVEALGVPAHILGRRYLAEALVQIAEAWPERLKISEALYPAIAAHFPDATGTRVERAIRHAIEVAEARNPEKFGALIGKGTKDMGRPTNSEAMYRLLELLEADLRGGEW